MGNTPNRVKGAVAGAAAAALLLGGATFALWTDSASQGPDQLHTGALAIQSVGDPTWTDTSADRADADHDIDPATWHGVPGDTVQGIYSFAGQLDGDNLVANLELEVDDAFVAPNGVTVTYTVERFDGTAWVALPGNAGDFASANNSNNVAELPTLPVDMPSDANLRVLVDVALADGTVVGSAGDVAQDIDIDLNEITAGLTQTRAPGTGGGF